MNTPRWRTVLAHSPRLGRGNALFLVPFLWMISSSLKPNYQIFRSAAALAPEPAPVG